MSGLYPREPCGFLKPDQVEEGGGRLAYVHQRGRQALQQEQMVVQFLTGSPGAKWAALPD